MTTGLLFRDLRFLLRESLRFFLVALRISRKPVSAWNSRRYTEWDVYPTLPFPLSPPSASGLQQHNSFDYISSYSYSYSSSSNNPPSLLTILNFLYLSLPYFLPAFPWIPPPSFLLSFREREFFWLCIYRVGRLHGSPIGATHVV